jgi:hypothetical protein
MHFRNKAPFSERGHNDANDVDDVFLSRGVSSLISDNGMIDAGGGLK